MYIDIDQEFLSLICDNLIGTIHYTITQTQNEWYEHGIKYITY